MSYVYNMCLSVQIHITLATGFNVLMLDMMMVYELGLLPVVSDGLVYGKRSVDFALILLCI